MGDAGAVIVDDQYDGDSYTIYYEGPDWYDITTDNQAIRNGTLSESQGLGDYSYLFFGSSISVYGTVGGAQKGKPATAVTSVYSVDNVVMTTYTAPNSTDETDGVLFFTSGTLDVKDHYLSVNITSATADYPYLLDYLIFIPPPTLTSDAIPSSSSSSASASSSQSSSTSLSWNGGSLLPGTATKSVASSGSSSSSTSSASQSTTPVSQADDTTSRSSHNAGAIAGGVVGGLIFLLAVLAAMFWCRRRREGRPRDVDFPEDKPVPDVNANGGIIGVTPYMLPRDYNTSSASVIPRETAAPLTPGSVSGTPAVVPSRGKVPLLQVSSPLAGPSVLPRAGTPSQNSHQRLLETESSGVSDTSGSGSDNRSQLAVARERAHGNGSMGDTSSGSNGRQVRSPKGARSPLPGPSGASPRQPAVHADSGLRFPGGVVPSGVVDDEVLSQAPTEFPPAYTPRQ